MRKDSIQARNRKSVQKSKKKNKLGLGLNSGLSGVSLSSLGGGGLLGLGDMIKPLEPHHSNLQYKPQLNVAHHHNNLMGHHGNFNNHNLQSHHQQLLQQLPQHNNGQQGQQHILPHHAVHHNLLHNNNGSANGANGNAGNYHSQLHNNIYSMNGPNNNAAMLAQMQQIAAQHSAAQLGVALSGATGQINGQQVNSNGTSASNMSMVGAMA